jgi:hypothetical protein
MYKHVRSLGIANYVSPEMMPPHQPRAKKPEKLVLTQDLLDPRHMKMWQAKLEDVSAREKFSLTFAASDPEDWLLEWSRVHHRSFKILSVEKTR